MLAVEDILVIGGTLDVTASTGDEAGIGREAERAGASDREDGFRKSCEFVDRGKWLEEEAVDAEPVSEEPASWVDEDA